MLGKHLKEHTRRWEWVLVVLIAPLMLFPQAERAWMLLVVLVVLAIQWWAWEFPIPVTALNPAILLMAVMTFVSIFVTPNLAESLGKLSGILYGFIAFFSVARHSRRPQGLRGALAILAITGIGLAGLGLVGTNYNGDKDLGLSALTKLLPVRIMGLPGAEKGIHPTELAGSLLWIILVLIVGFLAIMRYPRWLMGWSGKGKIRYGRAMIWAILFAFASLVTVGVLVLTQSRTAWAAMLIATVLTGLLVLKSWLRWVAAAFVLLAVIVFAVTLTGLGWENVQDLAIDSLPVGDQAVSLTTLNERVNIWSRAVWAIQDVPVTGLGMNIFRSSAYLLYPTFQLTTRYNVAHAHNEILQAALDLGLPGSVGLIALYLGAGLMLVKVIKAGGPRRLVGLGLMGGLLAHFLFGLTDAVALGAKPGFIFWCMLGMLWGLYDQCMQVRVEAA